MECDKRTIVAECTTPMRGWRRLLTLGVLLGLAACSDDATSGLGGGDKRADGSGADATNLLDGTAGADSAAGDADAVALSDGVADGVLVDGSKDTTSPVGDTASDSGADSAGDSGADATTLPEPKPGGLGWPCSSHAQCKPGSFCAGIGQGEGEGQCASAGCDSHADCAVASEAPFCCVVYDGTSYCLPQKGATACGGGDVPPGGDCSNGGQSDCNTAAGDLCLQTGVDAQCVSGCKTQQDCLTGHFCQVFDGGKGACIPFTPGTSEGTPCNEIGDCDAGDWCLGNEPGDPQAWCASFCKPDASNPGGCGTSQWCADFGGGGVCVAKGGIPAGGSCTADRFGCAEGSWCWGAGNPMAALCLPICQNDADCMGVDLGPDYVLTCQKGDSSKGLCVPTGKTAPGSSCAGAPWSCSSGSVCVGGWEVYNPDAICQQVCGQATTPPCPDGSGCTLYGDSGLCQPKAGKGQGESCAGDAGSCGVGLFCAGPYKQEICATLCSGSGDCGAGQWCAPTGGSQGLCLPAGELPVGAGCSGQPFGCAAGSWCSGWGLDASSSCIAPCPASGVCGAGAACADFGQAGQWCKAAGGIGQDGSCSNDPNGCSAGFACLAQDTDHARCAAPCNADADCTANHWCLTGSWGGWCVPEGTIAAGESCYLQAWSCAPGLVCLGNADTNPAAVCGKSCVGNAAICGNGFTCQAFGGGQAWCMPSGDAPSGSVCLDDPGSCAPGSLCIQGTPLPTCLARCGLGWPTCPNGQTCTGFAGSAVQLCVPGGFIPFGPVQVPI